MLLLRSGAGLARMLLYGIFCRRALFLGRLGYFAELAVCKALASSPRPPALRLYSAVSAYTWTGGPIRNFDSAADTAAPSSRLTKRPPEFDP